ncbi:hypothetical protein [Streptomyces naganishii]|uniref:DUF4232 domain-containing protein n=1 Tax=Streptomyces naganishii JCM 4654 TaxID=1306179 RepID=A0A918Y9X6_9ACTN|nr:hypothetical protein [Streptomyces naganishii]GHD96368.1 hypothetical protein GCM10010508_64720 [Streptomyces naganishii JCM 4654]
MGSLRKPVGPLPPSIYWRRRVVLLSVVALLTLLIAWILTSGGGGHHDNGGGSDGKNPTPSTITPGPSQSGPAISQHPGGRDESSGGDGSGTGSGSGSGDGSGSGSGGSAGTGGDGSGSGSGSGGGIVVTGDGAKGGGGTVATLPADTTLPNCTSGAVKLTLRSVRNSYSPGQSPEFEVTAKNTSGSDCKIDLGPKSAVVTVTQAGSSDDYWSSADCPKGAGSLLYRVPAGSGITYTLRWDRRPSAPQCATPPAGSAGAGTYLVQAQVPGYGKLQTSFVLSAD